MSGAYPLIERLPLPDEDDVAFDEVRVQCLQRRQDHIPAYGEHDTHASVHEYDIRRDDAVLRPGTARARDHK